MLFESDAPEFDEANIYHTFEDAAARVRQIVEGRSAA